MGIGARGFIIFCLLVIMFILMFIVFKFSVVFRVLLFFVNGELIVFIGFRIIWDRRLYLKLFL